MRELMESKISGLSYDDADYKFLPEFGIGNWCILDWEHGDNKHRTAGLKLIRRK